VALKRILVTGAGGFVGSHMIRRVSTDPAYLAFAVVHHPPPLDGIRALPVPSNHVYAGDLMDTSFADAVIQETRPDRVVHLAAQSSVPASWQDPKRTLTNNVIAQLNVLDGVARYVPRARVLVVGSSEEYGLVRPEDLPLAEDSPLRPESPYAVSKIAQDFLGLQFHLGRHLEVVRVRPFNLIGPGQEDRFVVPSFARQIAEAEAGMRPPVIEVGNLDARRDFTDVRDAVRAYAMTLERGHAGEVYNVGGGAVRSVREILDTLRGFARCSLDVKIDPARFRPVDAPVVQSDTRKIREEVGWIPEVPIDQSLCDVLDEWRQRVAQI
jgi:GDP-4-dehydro-6-deoxy-D-mannose reductase